MDELIAEMDAAGAKKLTPAEEKLDAAMMRLYNKKPVEEITVRELCAEAGVARTSFYAHYSNTQELLEEIENRTIGKMRQYTK